jgi:hypothetical protein
MIIALQRGKKLRLLVVRERDRAGTVILIEQIYDNDVLTLCGISANVWTCGIRTWPTVRHRPTEQLAVVVVLTSWHNKRCSYRAPHHEER